MVVPKLVERDLRSPKVRAIQIRNPLLSRVDRSQARVRVREVGGVHQRPRRAPVNFCIGYSFDA